MTHIPPNAVDRKLIALVHPIETESEIDLGTAVAGTVVVRDLGLNKGAYDSGESVFLRSARGDIHDPHMVRIALRQLTGSETIPAGIRFTLLKNTITLRGAKDQLSSSAHGCSSVLVRVASIDLAALRTDMTATERSELIAQQLVGKVVAVGTALWGWNATERQAKPAGSHCLHQPLSLAELRQLAAAHPDMAHIREIAFTKASEAATHGEWVHVGMEEWLAVTVICEQLTGIVEADERRNAVYRNGHALAYEQTLAEAVRQSEQGCPSETFILLEQLVQPHARESGIPFSAGDFDALMDHAYIRAAERALTDAEQVVSTMPEKAADLLQELSKLTEKDKPRVERLREKIVSNIDVRLLELMNTTADAIDWGDLSRAYWAYEDAKQAYRSFLPFLDPQQHERNGLILERLGEDLRGMEHRQRQEEELERQ